MKLFYYPPAETRIPLSILMDSIGNKKNDNLEKSLCNYLGVNNCIFADSGKALLSLLLAKLKEEFNNTRTEVIIPGYTCYSVAASVVKAGLKIRVYDLDPVSLQPDISFIKSIANDKVLAIINQHLFGIPSPNEEIKKIAENIGAFFIEDAAQGFGGSINDQFLGTEGDFGLFSFGRGKPLPIGHGGALVGKNLSILQKIKLNRTNEEYKHIVLLAMTQIISLPLFYWLAEILPLGLGRTYFNPLFKEGAMPEAIRKIIEKALPTLEDLNEHRHNISKVYENIIYKKYLISIPDMSRPVFTRYPLMGEADNVPKELKRLGVRRMYPKAIYDERVIKPYLAARQDPTPGASEIVKKLITLPTHKGISLNLAAAIAEKIKAYIQ